MAAKITDDAVWVTWERQTRNRSASAFFNVPLFEIIYDGSHKATRYAKSVIRTLWILFEKKPRYFFAQNPSVVLAILAVAVGRLAGCKVIIDAHNAGIHGHEKSGRLLPKLNRFVIRQADAVIVTNQELADHVTLLRGTPIVLPDPLPHFPAVAEPERLDKAYKLKALCITSWSDDEPFLDIIGAATQFSDTIDFYFSGNYKKIADQLPSEMPTNVFLLGFVGEQDFHRHLFSSDFCIDMTRRTDCMVCGAYESIAAEKPIILSDTAVQRGYFSRGTVFSKSGRKDIAVAIETMRDNLASLKAEASELKAEIQKREAAGKATLVSRILEL